MASQAVEKEALSPDQIQDLVFKLLRSSGPLCVSQISARLLIRSKDVETALEELAKGGAVERRSDRGRDDVTDDTAPWGLPKLFR